MKIFKEKKIDILFECIGQSDGVSKKVVEFALKNKINVITPNKANLPNTETHYQNLLKNNINLEFEASVAGGIPILKQLKKGWLQIR